MRPAQLLGVVIKIVRLLLPPPVLLILLLLFLDQVGADGARLGSPALTLPPTLPHGIATGDVTTSSAVLWAHSTATGVITFAYAADFALDPVTVVTRTVVNPLQPVTTPITGLLSNLVYHYRVTTSAGEFANGTLRTAAPVDKPYGLRFGVSGDQRGELSPYPALSNAITPPLHFFVLLGDTIYADFPSPALPISRATTLADFRLKYNEVYSTRFGLNVLADLRGNTALWATTDDHEVLNDFAGGAPVTTDRRFPETSGRINDTARYENGLQAFQEFHPLHSLFYGDVGDERLAHERQLYRYQTYGRDAAVIILDSRSFRDAPLRRADLTNLQDIQRFLSEAFTLGRTMLGSQPLADLQRDLRAAQDQGITWKFVLLPEPLQNLGPAGAQDRYEGFAAERTALLQFIHGQLIRNVVFIAADVHGTLVNNLTYQRAAGQPQILTDAFEITSGPVAFPVTMGPNAIGQASDLGLLNPVAEMLYHNLPVRNDPDDTINDKDDFVKTFLNQQLQPFGYDPIGLAGSPINARLLQGDYLAGHTFGWSEFAIDRLTQVLTVTTWGIPSYTEAELTANPSLILTRTPTTVSQFVVTPTLSGRERLYLPVLQESQK
jgi:phosphodiesterase/alkaline phosphatase D-like protein